MIRTDSIHSLTDFRQNAREHLERIARTGAHEVLTVNGEARGVVLSPETYEQLMSDAEFARNVKAIQQGIQAANAGRTVSADDVFAQIRSILKLDANA